MTAPPALHVRTRLPASPASDVLVRRAPDPAVERLAREVRALVASGTVTPFSAVAIVRAAVKAGASWDVVEDVVAEIAKGQDGIGGTADDVIPAATLEALRALLRSGAVRDVAVLAAGERAGCGCWPW